MCAPAQAETLVSISVPSEVETSVSLCAPAQAGTSLSASIPVQAEKSESTPNLEQMESLPSASANGSMCKVTSCETTPPIVINPVETDLVASKSEQDNKLPSIEEPSRVVVENHLPEDVSKGAVFKSAPKAIHEIIKNTVRRITIPRRNSTKQEENKNKTDFLRKNKSSQPK